MGRYQRADYRWRLLADPPVCRAGRPAFILNNCDRLRRGEVCWCRFETTEINEDLEALGEAGKADDWLTAGELEARDVEDLRDAMTRVVERAQRRSEAGSLSDDQASALDRLTLLVSRLSRLVEHDSGLSDRYADELDD